MKKNISIFCIFCFIILSNANAQTFRWGKGIESHKQYFCAETILGEHGDNIYVVMRYGSSLTKEYSLQIISKKTLSITKELKLTGEVDKSTLYYHKSWMIENRIIINYFTVKRGSIDLFYSQEYDISLNPIGGFKESENTYVVVAGDTLLSFDKTKKIVLDRGGKNIKVSYHSLDMSTKINTREFNTSLFSSDNVVYFDKKSVVGIDDAVYNLIEKTNINPKSKVIEKQTKNGSNFSYEILLLPKEGEPQQKSIKIQNKFLRDATIFLQKNGNIGVFGLSNDSKEDNATDFFVVLFDKNLNIVKKYEKRFDTDFVMSFSKKDNGIKNLYIKDVYIQEDEGVFIITESFNKKSTTSSLDASKTVGIIENGDIVCIKLSKDLDVQFIKQIAKEQSGIEPVFPSLNFQSIMHYSDEKKICMIYLDNEKNKDIIEGYVNKGMGAKRSLFLVEITNDGKISKKMLYETHPEKYHLAIASCLKLQDNKILLFSFRERQYMWGFLNL